MCSQYCPRFRRFPSICHCQRSWKSPSALASLRPVSLGVPPYSQSPTMDRGSYAFALVADICWHPQCRKCHLRITDRSRYGSPVPRVVAFASRGSMAEWPKREWLAEEEETMAVQQRMTAVAMEATTTAEALRSPVHTGSHHKRRERWDIHLDATYRIRLRRDVNRDQPCESAWREIEFNNQYPLSKVHLPTG